MIANKIKYARTEALEIAGRAERIVAARGKKVMTFEPAASQNDEAAMAKAILGPTGNLRAPAIRVGDALVVGFNAEMYASVFGG